MSDNFEKIPENLTDPSSVRNFLKDAENDAKRKQYSLLFHIVYALLCSAVVFFASYGNPLFLFITPAMCVFTFLYSPIYLKVAPVVLPLIFILIRTAGSSGANFFSVCQVLFVYLLCILSAAIITKASISGYTKTTLFVLLSAVFGIIVFCQVMFAFIAYDGTFSFSLLLDSINGFFDSIVNQSVALSQTPEGMEMLRSLAVSGKELSDADIIKLVKESVELSASVIKPLLPSFFVLSCMIYGFICVAIFSLFAKYFKINVFVCIMDRNWTYRPSRISTAVYDIVFFVFILSLFIGFPQNISVTVMNLLFVLTPLMCISGIRGIYTMLYRKTKNSLHSIIFTALIIAVATMIAGGFTFLILGSVGVTFVSARNREEKLVVPVKYAADLAILQKMSENNNVENTQSESDTDKDTL